METKVKSSKNQHKEYNIKWDSEKDRVYIFFSLKDGSESEYQVGEDITSLESAKSITELYLKDNEDLLLAHEADLKRKGLL